MALILAVIIIVVLFGRIGYEKSVHYSNEKDSKERVRRLKAFEDKWCNSLMESELEYWIGDPKNDDARYKIVKEVLDEVMKDHDFKELYPVMNWRYAPKGVDNETYNKEMKCWNKRYALWILLAKEGYVPVGTSGLIYGEDMYCLLDQEVMLWCVAKLREHGLTTPYTLKDGYFRWKVEADNSDALEV